MSRSLFHKFQLSEAKGDSPAGLSAKLTCATVLMLGAQAFNESYFGNKRWTAAADSVRSARHEAEEFCGNVRESLLSDLRPKALRPLAEAHGVKLSEVHTTSDFPLILARARDAALREQRTPVESDLLSLCTQRTTPDFRPIQGVKMSMLTDLPIRPEGTSVSYATLETSKDGYRIANYEKAIAYTWEMYLSDDLSIFTQALAIMGRRARASRILAVLQAIRDGVPRETFDSVGAPSIARLKAMSQAMAEYKNQNDEDDPRMISGLYVPAKWHFPIKETLAQREYLVTENGVTFSMPNPVFELAPHQVEPVMSRVLADDWIGIDNSGPSIEFATLDGFQGGPKTYTLMPDVEEHIEEGSFDKHEMAVKVGDTFGAKVTDASLIKRAKGAA